MRSALQPEYRSTVLVVDDDRDIRLLVARVLKEEGFTALTASDVTGMRDVLAGEHVDLVVLDIMMPGEDGLSACATLARQDGPPVVLLSAMGAEPDRIRGLEVGASHYLAKPCSAREIVATVQAALRSAGAASSVRARPYRFLGWTLDIAAHELLDATGALVTLTEGEFAILRALVERPRRVLTRELLLEVARGPNTDAFDRAVDVQVSRIRRKLRSAGDTLIRTVRNEGYLFTADVVRG